MIISHKHKYLFVELPRTGTTAIANELKENYDGAEIYKKHTTYSYFLKHCSEEKKHYTVFSCRRDPVDRVFSYYQKMKLGFYDYKFSEQKLSLYEKLYLLPTVKWVKEENVDFETFLLKKYKRPYCDWSILDHAKMDIIIDFENLNEDFKHALKKLGLQVKRDLPKKNVTTNKSTLEDEIANVSETTLLRVFGPFVEEQNYTNSVIYGLIEKKNRQSLNQTSYRISKSIYKFYYAFAGNSK